MGRSGVSAVVAIATCGTAAAGCDVTIEYYDFGVPATVAAPSPDTVGDITGKIESELGA
jgi:hypothetical protein